MDKWLKISLCSQRNITPTKFSKNTNGFNRAQKPVLDHCDWNAFRDLFFPAATTFHRSLFVISSGSKKLKGSERAKSQESFFFPGAGETEKWATRLGTRLETHRRKKEKGVRVREGVTARKKGLCLSFSLSSIALSSRHKGRPRPYRGSQTRSVSPWTSNRSAKKREYSISAFTNWSNS